MALLAYLHDSPEPVESFSATPEQWAAWRELPVGAFQLQVGELRVPAVLKRSPLGLQFFACAPGYAGVTEPKSIEHQFAQVELVRGLRAAGFQARVEQPGQAPDGAAWVADVMAEADGQRYAFEVQLSQQHLDDYRMRTERYVRSGVKVVWLVRSKHMQALTVARYRKMVREGVDKELALNQEFPDMPCLPLELADKEPLAEGLMKVVARTDGNPCVERLTLGDFAAGVLQGRYVYKQMWGGETRWVWKVSVESVGED